MNSFITQALLFIGFTIILVPFFQWLGLGSIIGYLVTGMIVGPYGFSMVNDSESLGHFAEMGVIILLFIIGLEIQPKKLWNMRKYLFGMGGVQIIVCTLVFATLGKYFELSPIASMIIGFSLSLSSTAFALQILGERSQLGSQFGQASFAILLMQDLVAIPALAIIPTLTSDNSISGGLTMKTFWLFVAILLGLILANRFLLRPLFRFVSSTKSREYFTAIALVIVLGVAYLMLKIGLSAALGTFIAGVLLADSEYRHELEADIGPFKNLLMGIFFIGVGMNVDLQMILARPVQIILLTVGYMTVKMLLVFFIGRVFMKRENSKLMALAVGQGGEFAFVIFGIVGTYHMADPEILAMLTVVITLSMAISPILFLVSDKVDAYFCKESNTPKYDVIENESPEVIVAGFGRFGQIITRVLRTQKIPFTAIDRDPNQIELVRKFGHKVYYGDASRLDILEAAGAAKAKFFVLAIDDVEDSIKAAETIREHFPHVKIYARSRNRGHTFDLMDMGVEHIKREVFDSSLNFSRDLLIDMGMDQIKVDSIIKKFADHDEKMVIEQHKVRNDEKQFMSLYHQAQAQLAEVLSRDEQDS